MIDGEWEIAHMIYLCAIANFPIQIKKPIKANKKNSFPNAVPLCVDLVTSLTIDYSNKY
jgi:hypothetical protein